MQLLAWLLKVRKDHDIAIHRRVQKIIPCNENVLNKMPTYSLHFRSAVKIKHFSLFS